MQSFKDLSVGAKLWAGLGVIVVSLALLVWHTASNSARLAAQAEAALDQMGAKVQAATRWADKTEGNVSRIQASMVSTDPAVAELFKEQIPATVKEIGELQKAIEAMPGNAAEKALLARIASERQVVLDSLGKIRAFKKAGDNEAAAREAVGPFGAAIKPYLASLNEFVKLQQSLLKASQADFAAERASHLATVVGMIAALVLAIVAGAAVLVRSIRAPLVETVAFAQRVSAGDLTATIDQSRRDEFGAMTQALAQMRDQLVRLVNDVRRGTDHITVASREIAAGNHDLSARTEQTASSLQQTAASIEQMSAAIQQSAGSAEVANGLAIQAGTSAQRGGEVVGQVVATMADINTSSRRISDIIGVIDGIAFQTNILALNAAVEAARAGEQGRGFAVVASEVRSLAQRSAQAAREIKALINASVEKVQAGSDLVGLAGTGMTEIVDNVARVRQIIAEIARASGEQAGGVQQINAAVANLDRVTQQNAALVEQSAAAATSMSEQAERLSDVVKTFRVGA